MQLSVSKNLAESRCCGCRHLTGYMLPLTISVISLSIKSLEGLSRLRTREPPVIKLDIINEVVNKTGITKTKAETGRGNRLREHEEVAGRGRSH